jgi:hypothetical protein
MSAYRRQSRSAQAYSKRRRIFLATSQWSDPAVMSRLSSSGRLIQPWVQITTKKIRLDVRLSTRERRTFSVTPAFSRLLRCKRDREVHLSFESVDADNKHGQLIAYTKAFTRPSPYQLPPS